MQGEKLRAEHYSRGAMLQSKVGAMREALAGGLLFVFASLQGIDRIAR